MADLRRIAIVLDRLVHPSTCGTDQRQTVEALRRLLNGNSASELLCQTAEPDSIPPDPALLREVTNLRGQLKKARAEIGRLKRSRQPTDETVDPWTYRLQKMLVGLDEVSVHDLLAKLCEPISTGNTRRLTKV